MGFLFNSFNLSAKSKAKFKFKSKSKSKSKLKLKSKSKYSDSSKAVANAESKSMKSAMAELNVRFLLRHAHNNEIPDYSVISTEGNSFRVLDEDDDDNLPRNLLRLFRGKNFGMFPIYDVIGCCGSCIWLVYYEIGSTPLDLVWDMETDSRISYFFPSAFPRFNDDVWASGFGFDPSSGHYKLVRCWEDCIVDKYAEVFSLETCSWKDVHYPFDLSVSPDIYSSIHINGFYYWIVRAGSDGSFAIMSFDFAKDRFRALIPLPKKEYFRKFVQVALVEFQGSLAAIYFHSENNPFIFEIWGWNARGRFWSLVSTLDIPSAAAPRAVRNLYNNDKLFLEDSKGDLLLYDLATKRLQNLGLSIDRRGSSHFFPYVKSTVGHSSSSSYAKKETRKESRTRFAA